MPIAHKTLQSGVLECVLMQRYYARAVYHKRRADACPRRSEKRREYMRNFAYYYAASNQLRIALNIPRNPAYGYYYEMAAQ